MDDRDPSSTTIGDPPEPRSTPAQEPPPSSPGTPAAVVERVTHVAEGATEAVKGAAKVAQTATTAAADVQSSARDVARQATVPPVVAVRRGRSGLIVACVALLGFGVIFAVVRAGRSAWLDTTIARRLQGFRSPVVSTTMRAVSWPGFPPQSRIIPPVIIAIQAWLGFRLEAGFQTLAWMTGLLSSALKNVMKRPRPLPSQVQVVAANVGGSSFPSGHVLVYVGTYGFLAYLLYTLIRPHTWRRLAAGALATLIGLVGPSRIYQGHHWPTDVLASYLLGLSYLIGLTALYRHVKGRPATSSGPLRPRAAR